RLSGLLKAPGAMGDQPYALFGVVVRRDPHTYVKSLVAFAPASVLEGVDDIDLASNDVVRVFSTAEAAMRLKTLQDYQNQQQAIAQYNMNPQLAAQTAPQPNVPTQPGGNGNGNGGGNGANANAAGAGVTGVQGNAIPGQAGAQSPYLAQSGAAGVPGNAP